jgi:hypothetical protein
VANKPSLPSLLDPALLYPTLPCPTTPPKTEHVSFTLKIPTVLETQQHHTSHHKLNPMAKEHHAFTSHCQFVLLSSSGALFRTLDQAKLRDFELCMVYKTLYHNTPQPEAGSNHCYKI